MLISQYAYFGLSSLTVSAAEMTAVLGIEPDETMVRGSRSTGPRVLPVLHRWKIVCREPGLGVDEQVARVVARLAPHADAIAALTRRLDAEDGEDGEGPSAVLEVVRVFNDEDGQDRLAGTPPELVEGPGLLGWHLGRDVLAFLHTTGAALDVDEYDHAG
ncbi:DUF4279 domain-containing protein [Kitasatospora cineracea]|uniref:Uncharacterized protein DUF4279 n=1 Tax=Kitasatospora cineracea TaxID=88074 RepID=A0A3N4R9Z8_9ACTN|nr:DUF4279 domain-containing protein [Kitasatospora cineracea]ROR35243.1 uncharacterized protein DUF4279 [Kitasatospora cineracea]RPE29496.1 uncharacterized protein DUF4279 [Kitasatospora cineracea]